MLVLDLLVQLSVDSVVDLRSAIQPLVGEFRQPYDIRSMTLKKKKSKNLSC